MNVIALEKLNAILANIKSDEAIKDFNQKNKRKNIDAIQFLTDEKPAVQEKLWCAFLRVCKKCR